ncbi:tRNA (N(6)-L-threonylcarbamoyladenosine(37)-C(2))-methylthiotransferase MtaB [Helicobacter suis]|uniref:tRNA (N(6)-L-threonylcarbamoyladenosine(37)-C(2))- methylthiotransferase MtaB n=1 Tax=Helicobacter suis TaxID=104628 RepID=UPI0013D29BA4|nr:tRNA (N(6)-L-threonylcarbamoyladenosine(37)-C(2))-methylthiotransferase MtaB [Helicobacter suis]
MMKQKVYFKTFGCRTNLFDTQVMLAHLKDFESTDHEEEAQIVVLNSCTVTNDADYSARSYAKKATRLGKKVYFTGCGANTQGLQLFQSGHVFGVFGHDHKEEINALLQEKQGFFHEDKQEHLDQILLSNFVGKTRAFVKIQEGCDFRCSYCIIPTVRGQSRSLNQDHVLKQITMLSQAGVLEVVLTGTNVGSYGLDRNTNLARLILKIADSTSIKRVRIGSLEPSQINTEFLDLLDHPILERHLHIALQHSHDNMLRRMRRRNRVSSDIKLLEKIASKGFAIGTDFIVGHPYEDELTWQEALLNFKQLRLTHIHPFIYSVRNNTPSSKMPLSVRVPGDIAKTRLDQIKTHVAMQNLAFRQQLRENKEVLEVIVESFKAPYYRGYDQYFNPVKILSKQNLKGLVCLNTYEVRADANYATL